MHFRRPVPRDVRDIGRWTNILNSIAVIAVYANAFLIALTSEFIPRLVYVHGYSPDGTLNGYVNFTLSVFNTSDLDPLTARMWERNETFYDTCHYAGHYNPPDAEDAYSFNSAFWHINFFRLLFVVLFQTLVSLAQLVANALVPNVPGSLEDKIW